MVARKPNGYYQVLVLGAMLRLHNLGYENLQLGEVHRLLVRLGLVQELDLNAYAAVGAAFNGTAAKELRSDFAEGRHQR